MHTQVDKTISLSGWVLCGAFSLMPACWLGCSCIPLCVDEMQYIKHSCPYCEQVFWDNQPPTMKYACCWK